jgi:hypothetical protein
MHLLGLYWIPLNDNLVGRRHSHSPLKPAPLLDCSDATFLSYPQSYPAPSGVTRVLDVPK